MVIKDLDDVRSLTRKYSQWSSPRGLRTDILPWRLWEKAKKLHWDPADLDFTQDAKDWASLTDDQRIDIAGLARGFMIGEEGVTLDILPLVMAMADEGRTEETMYLTTFAYEEAKHVDFFRRWFTAIGADVLELEEMGRERAIRNGFIVPDRERTQGMFESVLPRVMRRLIADRSSEAFLDAGVTYNQFVEGCLAIAGYRMWKNMFDAFGVLPGLREGLGFTQRDERRHIAYGTYLCRRLIAAEPDLMDFARERMYKMRDQYFSYSMAYRKADGDGSSSTDGQRSPGQQDAAAGYGSNGGPQAGAFQPFVDAAIKQVDRRIAVMEKARALSADEAERGTGAEEAEIELEQD